MLIEQCVPLQAAFADQHFDSDLNFCALEDDPVTKKVWAVCIACRSRCLQEAEKGGLNVFMCVLAADQASHGQCEAEGLRVSSPFNFR